MTRHEFIVCINHTYKSFLQKMILQYFEKKKMNFQVERKSCNLIINIKYYCARSKIQCNDTDIYSITVSPAQSTEFYLAIQYKTVLEFRQYKYGFHDAIFSSNALCTDNIVKFNLDECEKNAKIVSDTEKLIEFDLVEMHNTHPYKRASNKLYSIYHCGGGLVTEYKLHNDYIAIVSTPYVDVWNLNECILTVKLENSNIPTLRFIDDKILINDNEFKLNIT